MSKSNPKPKYNAARVNLAFEAIGTQWSIDLAVPAHAASDISKLITRRITQFDKAYSRFRPDSWVKSIERPGSYEIPDDFAKLFTFYLQMDKLTNGAVTPLIGDVMERAGYDAKYSLVPKPLQAVPKLTEALELTDNTLHVKYKVCLDFGAAGKGYLVDLIAELLLQHNVTDFIIDAGGDILHHSPAPTPVGLEDPTDTSKLLGVVDLRNASLCGSATNRRAWAGFHHIINPHTLRSVTDILAVWVVADSTMLADGLATCLFFVEPEALQPDFAFEYLVLKADNSRQVSAGFPAQLFHEATS